MNNPCSINIDLFCCSRHFGRIQNIEDTDVIWCYFYALRFQCVAHICTVVCTVAQNFDKENCQMKILTVAWGANTTFPTNFGISKKMNCILAFCLYPFYSILFSSDSFAKERGQMLLSQLAYPSWCFSWSKTLSYLHWMWKSFQSFLVHWVQPRSREIWYFPLEKESTSQTLGERFRLAVVSFLIVSTKFNKKYVLLY